MNQIKTINIVSLFQGVLDKIIAFDTTDEGKKECDKVFGEELLKIDPDLTAEDIATYTEDGYEDSKHELRIIYSE